MNDLNSVLLAPILLQKSTGNNYITNSLKIECTHVLNHPLHGIYKHCAYMTFSFCIDKTCSSYLSTKYMCVRSLYFVRTSYRVVKASQLNNDRAITLSA